MFRKSLFVIGTVFFFLGSVVGLCQSPVDVHAYQNPYTYKYWKGDSDWWDYDHRVGHDNWSDTPGGPGTAGCPQNGDIVSLIQHDSKNRTIYYRNEYNPNAIFQDLTIDSTGPGLITLSMQTEHSLNTNYTNIGCSGVGKFEQNAGTHTVKYFLELGHSENARGTYVFQGGALNVGIDEYIGSAGSGTFEQGGGEHAVIGKMLLGVNANSSGSYLLSNGNLTTRGAETIVGLSGIGFFEQRGGEHTTGMGLWLGQSPTSHGTYILSGGILDVPGWERIGWEGIGDFMQSGGEHNVKYDLELGVYVGGVGSYNLTNGSLSVGSSETVGYLSSGTFEMNGGEHKVNMDLYVGGRSDKARGTFSLNGGTFSAGEGVYIGREGAGEFRQSSGLCTIGQLLSIGNFPGSTGRFDLSGGAVLVNGDEFVGYPGAGYFNQSGGEHVVRDDLTLGFGSKGVGTFLLDGGELLVGLNEHIGDGGIGIFSQKGGSHTVTGDLIVADGAGGSGTYNLEGGTLKATSLRNNGTFNYRGGNLDLLSMLINKGLLNLNSNGTQVMDFDVTNEGMISIHDGTQVILNRSVLNAGNINNYGTVANYGTLDSVHGTFRNLGTFKGTGRYLGNFVNDGRVAPGSSIGTMTFEGSYTHNTGSTYEVEVDPAGNADLINVIGAPGTATINGGSVEVKPAPGIYRHRTKYTILHADDGVTGAFDTATSDLAFLDPSLAYKPFDVVLTLTRNDIKYADVALTGNQWAVGRALDEAALDATGDMLTVINAVSGLSDSQARSAYDQMGGASHSASMASSFDCTSLYLGTVARHLEGYRLGRSRLTGTGLASRGDIHLAMAGRESMGDTKLFLVGPDLGADHVLEPRWNIWATGMGAYGNRDDEDIASRYDYNIYGFVAGLEYSFSPSLLVGVAGGYSTTNVEMDLLLDSSNVESYQGTVYASYVVAPWYLEGILSYGRNRYETWRGVTFGGISRIAMGNYDGDELSGYMEGGCRLEWNGIDIRPLLSLQAIHLSRDGFTEEGADALNLVVADEDANSVQGSLGVHITKEYRMKSGTILVPDARVRWIHEFSSDDHLVNARFAGSPAGSFVVKGDQPDRDSLVLGLGLTARVDNKMYLYIDYDASISGDLFAHAVSAGITYSW